MQNMLRGHIQILAERLSAFAELNWSKTMWMEGLEIKKELGGCHSSVVSSAPNHCGLGFESQAHHLCFFQFLLLKLLWENDENKQKEAGLALFKKQMNLFERRNDVGYGFDFKYASSYFVFVFL